MFHRALLVVMLLASLARAADYVWWEGEQPKATNFPAKSWFSPANPQEADVLSGGQWLAGAGKGEGLFAAYEITVPKDGVYHFYARKFWKHGPFRWRFDVQDWAQCTRDVALLDNVELRKFICANWVFLGTVKLSAGVHSLRIELTDPTSSGCFDCFVLTPTPFTPRGKLKPGAKLNRAPAGWFAFEPDADPFGQSPIDLRYLNEREAGENGHIRVKGDGFVHEKTGQPARFWAVDASPEVVRMDKASVDHLARFLAKRGVNMVRMHGALYKSGQIEALDPAYLDHYYYFIAAMKRQGIYVSLSIYWPIWMPLKPNAPFEGYNNTYPFALLFFDAKLQNIYRGWWQQLLSATNPYTKLSIAEDPAVAIVELVNEDSCLFWTFEPYGKVPAAQMPAIEKTFGEWLAKRHGTVEKALASWGGQKVRGDDPAAGRAGLMNLWNLINTRNRRAQETAEFLTLHQRAFFDRMYSCLKKDLGYKGLIYASNWKTASEQYLGALEKYSNMGCDLLDRHGYFGGQHKGPRAGFAIDVNDQYADASSLLLAGNAAPASPLMDLAYNGKPSIMTELGWTTPNRYRGELPLMAATYGALQGTDAMFFFCLSGPGWQDFLSKFSLQTPSTMGQFPAAALVYRLGLVQQGPIVVRAEVKLAELLALKGAPISAAQNLDALRAKDVPVGQAGSVPALSAIDPLAFFVGRVEMNVTDSGGQSQVIDLPKFVDRSAKVVVSATKQVAWDYGRGLMMLNAPSAQGVVGFLSKTGEVALGDVAVRSSLDFGAIVLVSMDGQPLKTSGKMLLQVMSEDNNYGWTAAGEPLRTISSLGGPPLVVRRLAGTVSLSRPDAASLNVTPLDLNGYRTTAARGAASITLRESTLYYLIEK